MEGQLARSLQPPDNVQDVLAPILSSPSAYNKATKESGKTVQIRNMKHEKLCEQLKLATDYVSTLSRPDQRSADNDNNIRNFIRV